MIKLNSKDRVAYSDLNNHLVVFPFKQIKYIIDLKGLKPQKRAMTSAESKAFLYFGDCLNYYGLLYQELTVNEANGMLAAFCKFNKQIPEPVIVEIIYLKDNVPTKYKINVIGKSDELFTGYVAGHGVRSFRYDKIISIL
jgi:hypothetical protein